MIHRARTSHHHSGVSGRRHDENLGNRAADSVGHWECHYSVLRPYQHPGLSAASSELARLLADSANLTCPVSPVS